MGLSGRTLLADDNPSPSRAFPLEGEGENGDSLQLSYVLYQFIGSIESASLRWRPCSRDTMSTINRRRI